MKVFVDTSVLVAAFMATDRRHAECRSLLLSLRSDNSECGSHSLAEFYSVLTRLPVPLRLLPEQAWLLVEEVRERVSTVTLTPQEHFEELRRMARGGIRGGQVYDALILACARKSGSDRIYTLDLTHFKALAPDLADRIATP